jgi:hypothetical protein
MVSLYATYSRSYPKVREEGVGQKRPPVLDWNFHFRVASMVMAGVFRFGVVDDDDLNL